MGIITIGRDQSSRWQVWRKALISISIYEMNKSCQITIETSMEKTEEIDGDYCDVHYQFAQVLFQQEKYLEFEDRITKSVLCPFTMTQSYSLYTRYWKTVLHDSQGDVANAQRRYKRYNGIIEEAIKKETAKENAEKYGNKKIYSTGGKSEL